MLPALLEGGSRLAAWARGAPRQAGREGGCLCCVQEGPGGLAPLQPKACLPSALPPSGLCTAQVYQGAFIKQSGKEESIYVKATNTLAVPSGGSLFSAAPALVFQGRGCPRGGQWWLAMCCR